MRRIAWAPMLCSSKRFAIHRASVFIERLEARRLLNNPPQASIDMPDPFSNYGGGQIVEFSGSATDPEQGILPPSAFYWSVVFHHQTHTHPFQNYNGVTGGSFEAPVVGEPDAVQWFRIHLTVRDGGGLEDSTFIDVVPRTSQLMLDTSPSGMPVTLDGQPLTSPYSFIGVEGMTRQLGVASNQFFNGQWHEFLSWSDGGARMHEIVTPEADTTYTAHYEVDVNGPFVQATDFVFSGNLIPAPLHELRVTFNEDVSGSIGPDDVLVENLTQGSTIPTSAIGVQYDPNTNTAYFTFPGFTNGMLPDGRYRATILAPGVRDPVNHPMVSNSAGNFFFLQGDANHDARVNLTDYNILAANFGRFDGVFTQGDFSYDGRVNLADYNVLSARFGNALPPATARLAGSTMRGIQFSSKSVADNDDPLSRLLA